jgi:hypothetical protein
VNPPVHATVLRSAVLCAALLLAACRGGEGADSAESGEGRESARSAEAVPGPVNRPVTPPAEPLARAGEPAPAPAPRDSAAAAREDVSPEWKQRARSMESHARCLERAAQAPPEARPRLEEACSRHPDAPR